MQQYGGWGWDRVIGIVTGSEEDRSCAGSVWVATW